MPTNLKDITAQVMFWNIRNPLRKNYIFTKDQKKIFGEKKVLWHVLLFKFLLAKTISLCFLISLNFFLFSNFTYIYSTNFTMGNFFFRYKNTLVIITIQRAKSPNIYIYIYKVSLIQLLEHIENDFFLFDRNIIQNPKIITLHGFK